MEAHPIPQPRLSGHELVEWQALASEPDAELRATALLGFARRLESEDRLAAAAEVYAALPENLQAAAALSALTGGGSFGQRSELLLRRFAREAADPHTIAPMFAAASLAGLVKTFSYGRLLGGGAGALLAEPVSARLAATGMGFAAEVPAFVAAHRLLSPAAGDLDRELAGTALSLGCLKLFGFAGGKFSAGLRVPLAAPSAFAGLYTAHLLEERLGWRPAQDAGGRAVETLATFLSLQVGAHLGARFLGPRYQTFQNELALSLEPRPALASFPGLEPQEAFAGPLQMSGKDPLQPGAEAAALSAQEAEAKVRGYVLDRPLSEYRSITSLSLMGDLVKNIERRLATATRPLRLLELGPGKGVAARALKAKFGDRLRVETLDRYPLPEGGDRHYEGSWPETEVEGRYDLILSIFGPHSHHDGKLQAMLQRSFDHLAPEGEFFAALTRQSLLTRETQPLRRLDHFSTLRGALERGLALRLERTADASLIYARRLGDAPVPLLEEILAAQPGASAAEHGRFDPQRNMRGCVLSFGPHSLQLSDRVADRLTDNFDLLGLESGREGRHALAQGLLDDYILEHTLRMRRPPRLEEVQKWLEGEEPSSLWQPGLLVDALLRSPALLKRLAAPGAVALGVGLLQLFQPRNAWAAEGPVASAWEFLRDNPALVAVGVGFVTYWGWKWASKHFWNLPKERQEKFESDSQRTSSRAVVRKHPRASANDNSKKPHLTAAADSDPRLLLARVPKGWARQRRVELERKLSALGSRVEERDAAAEHYVLELMGLRAEPSEMLEALALLWGLSWDPRLSQTWRESAFMIYRNSLGNPDMFPPGSPQVYREALRLRTIFSDPERQVERRVAAADAYGRLQRGFNLHSVVGHGEAGKGRMALQNFLESGLLSPRRRDYFTVDSAKNDLERRMHHAGIFRYLDEEE